MSWTDRVSDTIGFLSPEGRSFIALWKGSNRSKAKKLGAFSPPKRKGTIYQDLDVDAVKYPLTFFFDGDNHDLEADLFFETCNETGVWTVAHPVHGALNLQLVTVTEKVQPVINANFTEFDTTWVEPLDEDQIASSAELAAQIESQLIQANQATADQMAALADQSRPSTIQALKDAGLAASNAINKGLQSISELSADIARVTNAVQRATTTNLSNPLVSLNSLATQIQVAAQAPSLATQNVTERASAYGSAILQFFGVTPDQPTIESRNTLAVTEIAMVSLLGTLPRIASTGELSTRSDAIALAESLADTFDQVTNELDLAQELYKDNFLKNQYFSQSQSYSDTALLIALGIKYLLLASFDLKVEKRFALGRDTTPIDITISEYGTLGDNDENLDFFISTNKLKDKEILLMPAGKEVVVYV